MASLEYLERPLGPRQTAATAPVIWGHSTPPREGECQFVPKISKSSYKGEGPGMHCNLQVGAASRGSDRMVGDQAIPGLIASATTPDPSSLLASANVQKRFKRFACAYASIPT